jgi:hypothetical protein
MRIFFTRFFFNRISLAMAVIGAVAVAASMFLISLSLGIEVARKNFRARHLEATNAIDHVYAYFKNHGHWPSDDPEEESNRLWLPPDWKYKSCAEGKGGTAIWLHGPYHMTLLYRFLPPKPGAASAEWTLSLEGDKAVFLSEAHYGKGEAEKAENQKDRHNR